MSDKLAEGTRGTQPFLHIRVIRPEPQGNLKVLRCRCPMPCARRPLAGLLNVSEADWQSY